MKKIVKLDEVELKDRAESLAATCEEITNLETELKDISKDYKDRIGNLKKERARLARVVRTGQEEQADEGPLLKMALRAE